MSAEEDREPISTVHSKASVPVGAVFLSYASEDAGAAERIASALLSGGIQVWFDKSELRGGDAWDRQIRQQIHDCRLFIAVISSHTDARDEGYFRREWKLAVDRTHDMAEGKAFLVPVVIDDTADRSASVPDKFRDLQWTRLPGGITPPAFVERMRCLLAPHPTTASRPAVGAMQSAPAIGESVRASWRSKAAPAGVVAVLAAVCVYLLVARPWVSKRPAGQQVTTTAAAPTAPVNAASFAPPPHSIAVLPFVNMSGDKEQDYFSDGLSEELLNDLARINELQVAARTSAFSFKGKDTDVGTIARKLNVGSVLEGSVRRSGHKIRITAQLNNAVTGFHIWSQTYDRDLGDVLQLQTEIATAVATALKVTLLGDAAAKIELGGTRNPAAFDAYLRGRKAHLTARSNKDYQTEILAFGDAIGLDPNYALAYANRSMAFTLYAGRATEAAVNRESLGKAQSDAMRAIALTPDLADGHLALAFYFDNVLDFSRATEEYERALALAPGNARGLEDYGVFTVYMGRTEPGIAAIRRAVVLDPLNRDVHYDLGASLYEARHYREALEAFQDALTLDPELPWSYAIRGLTYYALGDFERARATCESKSDYWHDQQCLAVTYDKLGRHSDAEAMLAKMQDVTGRRCGFSIRRDVCAVGQ